MKTDDIQRWATNLIEGDQRVDWQRGEPVTGPELARIVRAEEPATDDELEVIASLINQELAC